MHQLEHDLHSSVSFVILPLFAFVNAGVTVLGMDMDQILGPVPVGVALGLLLGKQLGVFGLCWLGIKLGIAKLPENVDWAQLYGIAILCGVGFTMCMFIGSLAFEDANSPYLYQDRIGILGGSIIAALMGYFWLHKVLPKPPR